MQIAQSYHAQLEIITSHANIKEFLLVIKLIVVLVNVLMVIKEHIVSNATKALFMTQLILLQIVLPV